MFKNKKNKVNGELKIVLLGESGVGKSSILKRYIDNTFVELLESTIGASFMNKKVIIENKVYNLDIWDTAGQERYKSLMPMYYRNAKGAIIVYSVDNFDSFNVAKKWIYTLTNYHQKNIIIYLVGNKTDLTKNVFDNSEINEIIKEDNIFHITTSAKNGNNIEKLFYNLSQKMVSFNYKKIVNQNILSIETTEPKTKSCC